MARETGRMGWYGFLCVLLWTTVPAAAMAQDPYVGTAGCSACHADQAEAFQTHGHPRMLRPVSDGGPAGPAEIQPPQGTPWEKLTYLIGGFKNYARFVDHDGFVVTGDQAQWSFCGKTLTPFKKDIPRGQLKYGCIKCHTVGWKASGAYSAGEGGRLAGIPGVWYEDGVGCESCHGPGRGHAELAAQAPAAKKEVLQAIRIDRSTEACGWCHNRNRDNTLNLVAADLLQSRQQYAELKRSPKGNGDLTCLSCHDAHRSSTGSSGFAQTCRDCHDGQEVRIKAMAHLRCIACHMPFAARGAYDKRIKGYRRGDTRSHVFAISSDSGYVLDDGTGHAAADRADGQIRLTVEMTCYACHQSGAEVVFSRDVLLGAMKRVHREHGAPAAATVD